MKLLGVCAAFIIATPAWAANLISCRLKGQEDVVSIALKEHSQAKVDFTVGAKTLENASITRVYREPDRVPRDTYLLEFSSGELVRLQRTTEGVSVWSDFVYGGECEEGSVKVDYPRLKALAKKTSDIPAYALAKCDGLKLTVRKGLDNRTAIIEGEGSDRSAESFRIVVDSQFEDPEHHGEWMRLTSNGNGGLSYSAAGRHHLPSSFFQFSLRYEDYMKGHGEGTVRIELDNKRDYRDYSYCQINNLKYLLTLVPLT